MSYLKTHYQVTVFGSHDASEQWEREGLTPNKVKFCDGLMLKSDRQYDFTKDVDGVDCLKCLKKIDIWAENGFDLPF